MNCVQPPDRPNNDLYQTGEQDTLLGVAAAGGDWTARTSWNWKHSSSILAAESGAALYILACRRATTEQGDRNLVVMDQSPRRRKGKNSRTQPASPLVGKQEPVHLWASKYVRAIKLSVLMPRDIWGTAKQVILVLCGEMRRKKKLADLANGKQPMQALGPEKGPGVCEIRG